MEYSNQLMMFESYCKKDEVDGKIITADMCGTRIKLKMASTDSSRSKGFTGEGEPTYKDGILFMFDEDIELQFWMKNINFKLDILFFDSKLKLVDSFTMDKYDGSVDRDIKQYKSNGKAMYAVETKAGWISKYKKNSECNLRF